MNPPLQHVFIIGSPRSGTTMLQILLGAHARVATTMETTLFERYVNPLLRSWNDETETIKEGRWKKGLPCILDESELDDFIQKLANRFFTKILALKPEATHVLDKNPVNSYHTAAIKRFVPNAKFIHIIRDGRDVACSMVAARQSMDFGAAKLPEAAVAWRDHVLQARHARSYAGDYHEIRYEELLSGGVDAYSRVLEFCGLPADQSEIARLLEENDFEKMKARRQAADHRMNLPEAHYRKGKSGGWAEELSARDRYTFHRLAGDLLCELGYAQPEWWSDSSLEQITLPVQHELAIRSHHFWRGLSIMARAFDRPAFLRRQAS